MSYHFVDPNAIAICKNYTKDRICTYVDIKA